MFEESLQAQGQKLFLVREDRKDHISAGKRMTQNSLTRFFTLLQSTWSLDFSFECNIVTVKTGYTLFNLSSQKHVKAFQSNIHLLFRTEFVFSICSVSVFYRRTNEWLQTTVSHIAFQKFSFLCWNWKVNWCFYRV